MNPTPHNRAVNLVPSILFLLVKQSVFPVKWVHIPLEWELRRVYRVRVVTNTTARKRAVYNARRVRSPPQERVLHVLPTKFQELERVVASHVVLVNNLTPPLLIPASPVPLTPTLLAMANSVNPVP